MWAEQRTEEAEVCGRRLAEAKFRYKLKKREEIKSNKKNFSHKKNKLEEFKIKNFVVFCGDLMLSTKKVK